MKPKLIKRFDPNKELYPEGLDFETSSLMESVNESITKCKVEVVDQVIRLLGVKNEELELMGSALYHGDKLLGEIKVSLNNEDVRSSPKISVHFEWNKR